MGMSGGMMDEAECRGGMMGMARWNDGNARRNDGKCKVWMECKVVKKSAHVSTASNRPDQEIGNTRA